MNAAVKAAWTDALCGKRYEQGRSAYLRDVRTGGFCPLGVLCDLYRKATGDGEWKLRNETWLFCVDVPDGKLDGPRPYATTLPKAVRQWAGLDACNPLVGENSVTYYHLRETFPQIAKRVETYL